ncbi:YcaO-like family protein [Lactobacillus xylocopicola]|uniref:YcaO domain-containing protein n=1 Tax=Lactobacillus xylocopicola TaxID=2976676 RepID=A0ABM8BEW9_9LACO|nr:YcaO-like family protein [Lactobacillus xylocopicola]BDR59760.1 hypothetical protein KIM322_00210 [Lactobacillus xylocopicola]
MQFERECESTTAHENISNFFHNSGMKAIFKSFFSIDIGLQIVECKLFKNDVEISVGMGKGSGKEPVLGSEFESLEHYYYNHQRHEKNVRSVIDIIGQNNGLASDPALEFVKEYYVNVDSFKSINKNENLFYPSFLNDTNYVETDLKDNHSSNYSSDNGVASGSSVAEATMHSINELIERDTISKFLIKYGLNQNQDVIANLIDINSLPSRLRRLVFSIEKTVNAELELVKIINIYSIPTYMAVIINKQISPISFYGSGTSLSEEYAIERAITEAFQLFCVSGKEDKNIYYRIEKIWNNIPIMKDMLTLNFINELNKIECSKTKKIELSLNDLLNKEVEILSSHRVDIFRRVILNNKSFSLVQCLIPEFERFNLVLEGQLVLPRIAIDNSK